MAVATTWAELKTEVANWAPHDDIATNAAGLIGYAEARLNRELRVPEMEADSSASISTSSVTLPTDFLELRSVYINSSPRVVLSEVSPARLREIYPDSTATDIPRRFAMQSGSEMLFGPAPDTTYTAIINYWAKIPALGSGQATNWLLTSHPDLYLAAALTEGHLLMADEQRAAVWDSRTVAKIAELNALGRRKARSQAPTLLLSDLPVQCVGYDIMRG